MSYTPTNWQTGDTVTAEKLNKMESGIAAAADPFVVTLTPTSLDLSGIMDKTPQEITAAISAGKQVVFSIPVMDGTVPATQFMFNPGTEIYTAYANITYDSGNGTNLLQIGTDGEQSIYSTAAFKLTPVT